MTDKEFKLGDKGITRLKKKSVFKTDPIIELIGQIDHVNSLFGMFEDRPDIQNLFNRMKAYIAGYDIPLTDVTNIEREIEGYDVDRIKKDLTRPRSALHMLRTEIRKAEVLAWKAEMPTVAILLDRLSDLYLILAIEEDEDFSDDESEV